MNEKKPQHNPNLWKQEGELNQAEQRVLHAFREGWKADDWDGRVVVSSAIPEKPTEKQIKNHWQGAILRARVLRDLFLGNYGEFDARHITISLAWIEGALELDYCESKFPIAFSKCVFPDGISLQHATIPFLSLQGCEVGQLDESMLERQTVFLQQTKVNTNVFLDDGFKANGEVTLTGAEIGGQLTCTGGHFQSDLMAHGLKVGNSVFLRDGFQAHGKVIFAGANIGDRIDCRRGYFKHGLMAGSLRSRNVFLHDGFKADGGVNLNGANIGGQIDCSGGCFKKGLIAQGLKTGHNVYLSDGFKASGKVDLLGADIGEQLVCGGGYFAHGIYANNLIVKQDLILEGAEINVGIALNGANVGGVFQNLSVWPHEKICFADGFRYREIKNSDDSSCELSKGIAWLDQTQKIEFRPQPYEQLMAVYRLMGHTNWAREVGFALEERRSKEFKGRWSQCFWRIWYFILRWTIGYGYRPFIALGWVLALLVLGTFMFSNGHSHSVFKIPPASFINNEWVPSEGEALASARWEKDRKPPLDYVPFSPFVYSLEAAFPVLSLGQLEKWHPKNRCLLVVRWIWTFIGSSLLAILALFGVGVLGPRWRGGDEDG